MGEIIDFIFGNLFLIIIIISGIVGFLSSNKEDDEKRQKERPPRSTGRQPRPAPAGYPRREQPVEKRDPQEVFTTQREPDKKSVRRTATTSGSISEEQQAQMDQLQRKFGGGPDSSSSGQEVVDTITEDGLDLDFIKNQQLQRMENISIELSQEQKVLKNDIRSSLRKKGLINGIIMAEVLGKPRALKPYESITSERYKR